MRDINIQVKENHTVDFENDYAGLNRENLQGNIIFNFDKFISGQARVEIVINNVSGYINLDQVEQTYILPIKSSLLTGNDILMQLVIDEPATYNLTTDTDIDTKKIYYEKVGDNYVQVEHPRKADLGNYYEASIPVWKSETFYLKVGFSINAEETIPEQYPSWIETLNNLINETESAIEQASNVNISATQTQSGATITITNKDGESNSVNITNGADGTDGKDAKINGYNTITIQEGTNIGIEQNGEILTINNTYDDTSIKNDITTLQNTKANKSELSVYSLITETGAKIDLEINSTTYVLTAKLYDKNNVLLSTSTGIDLPLETMVVGASYDSETKEIVLTLKNGQTVRFSVADLVSGLQTEITSDNKLASDLVDDTNQTHKFVSASEKTQITTNATNITSLQNNKEDKSNKVTSISSSSTDTQYPSAKCMYDSQALQDNEISDLKSENDYLNSIINQLPKVSSQGTILTLNNTINGKMNIELGTSELEQETTTGKNLWNSVLTYGRAWNNSDGTGNVWSNQYARSEDFIKVMPNTTYTISFISKDNAKTGNILSYTSSKTFIESISLDTNLTFTTSATTEYLKFNFFNVNNYSSGDIYNIQLEVGSSATTYEPYTNGPAPNPSYPMPIHTISGNNKVVVEGSNLFVDNNLQSGTWGSTNGAYYPCGSRACTINKIKVVPNQKYVISNNNTSTYSFRNIVDGYQKDGTFVQRLTGTNGDVNGTVLTMPSNVEYINVTFNETSDTVTWSIIQSYLANGTLKPQINKGETLLPYAPYVSQEANINLGDIEYCEIGDYKDEFIRDNEGNWGIRKNIGKVVLDGSEYWTKGSASTLNYSVFQKNVGIDNNTSVSTLYCTDFIDIGSTSSSDTYDYDNIGLNSSNKTLIRIWIAVSRLESNNETGFRNWLSTHNTTVYYVLATPTYTPITGTLAEELENIYQYLLSYKGQTNISQINNDLPFNISANALLDLNTLVGE